jgi:hypothetical protein
MHLDFDQSKLLGSALNSFLCLILDETMPNTSSECTGKRDLQYETVAATAGLKILWKGRYMETEKTMSVITYRKVSGAAHRNPPLFA